MNEKEQFDKLYDYVKNDILCYYDKVLPKYMILRLRGLKNGKFIANKNIRALANYSYNDILLTFKIMKNNILSSIKDESKFKDEKHKFNYIMIIIESNINDVVDRIKKSKLSENKISNIDVEISDNGYVKRDKKINDKFKKMW